MESRRAESGGAQAHVEYEAPTVELLGDIRSLTLAGPKAEALADGTMPTRFHGS